MSALQQTIYSVYTAPWEGKIKQLNHSAPATQPLTQSANTIIEIAGGMPADK